MKRVMILFFALGLLLSQLASAKSLQERLMEGVGGYLMERQAKYWANLCGHHIRLNTPENINGRIPGSFAGYIPRSEVAFDDGISVRSVIIILYHDQEGQVDPLNLHTASCHFKKNGLQYQLFAIFVDNQTLYTRRYYPR